MTDIEATLKDLSEKYRAGLNQLQAQVENAKRSDSRQYSTARQEQSRFCREQGLIEKARELAAGNQAAIGEIEMVLRSRSAHPHTRMVAAMLLAAIDSTRALELLVGRIVDKSDSDTLRFFCAMQIANSRNGAVCALLLRAINDPSTDEEFDQNAMLRAKMIDAGVSVNLRRALIWGLLDRPGGTDLLAAQVRAPMRFQNGWLFTIISLWQKADSDEYILLAAAVLQNRSYPEKLRINSATALYLMRRETKGHSYFPKAAWDALRGAWTERDFGELHHRVGEVLKLQGA